MRGTTDNALVLTFDIGGSFIRAGRFDPESSTVTDIARDNTPNFLTSSTPTADELLAEVFARVSDIGGSVLRGREPDIVVVGYPGPLTASGVALRSPTILGDALDGPHDVKAALQAIWPRAEVLVQNDLTCAGFAYVARGHRDFCILTVGSGIGNKVFIDGLPVTGRCGRGGEIGHLVVHPSFDCAVGDLADELGNISSGRGTVQLARCWAERRPECLASSDLGQDGRSTPHMIDSATLVRAFRDQDGFASRVIDAACYPLATAIATLHLMLGLESFFIVGGFAKALGQGYLDLLIRHLRRITWDLGQNWASMVALGSDHNEEALLGAGFVASRLLSRNAPSSEASSYV